MGTIKDTLSMKSGSTHRAGGAKGVRQRGKRMERFWKNILKVPKLNPRLMLIGDGAEADAFVRAHLRTGTGTEILALRSQSNGELRRGLRKSTTQERWAMLLLGPRPKRKI